MKSRILCWDEKWFFIEQRFVRQNELVAVGLVKGLLRGRSANIPTATVLEALNLRVASPEIPHAIRLWLESEKGS